MTVFVSPCSLASKWRLCGQKAGILHCACAWADAWSASILLILCIAHKPVFDQQDIYHETH